MKIPESSREETAKNIRLAISNGAKTLESKWMRFFMSYDPRPALKQVQCPVLAIIGSKDLQVLPNLNMPEIKKALTEGGNRDFEMAELEGLNHLFQECKTGSMSEYFSIQETFNPLALKRIGDWIENHTTPVALSTSSGFEQKPRARDLGIPFGGTPGPLNAITDVSGVEVGHSTIISGKGKNVIGKGPVRTGVTQFSRAARNSAQCSPIGTASTGTAK